MTYPRTVRQVRATDPVNSLMSWPVATVETTDSLADVARELAADEIGAVLVLHEGVLAGVVSERDVTAHVATGTDPTQLAAGDSMSTDLVTVPPEAPIVEAARIMREAQIRHLPVVSDGQIAGILSMRDVFHVLLGLAGTTDPDTAATPMPAVETTWRHHQRAVWLMTCPICGRETEHNTP